MRSINTSLIALLPVGALLFIGAGLLGAGTLKDLALAQFVGLAAGTYSSIFIATPLLADLKEREPALPGARGPGRAPARVGEPPSRPTGSPAAATATAGSGAARCAGRDRRRGRWRSRRRRCRPTRGRARARQRRSHPAPPGARRGPARRPAARKGGGRPARKRKR